MEKYLNLTNSEAEKYYYTACKNNDLESIKYLVENYKYIDLYQEDETYTRPSATGILFSNNYREIIDYLVENKELFCIYRRNLRYDVMYGIGKSGNIELLKYVINKYKKKLTKTSMKGSLRTALRIAIHNNHNELVKYILLSKELPVNASFSNGHYYVYRIAAENGNLELVKYFLNSPEFKTKPKVSEYNHYAIRFSSWKNHMNVVEYLLTSDDLTEKADIHACGESVLFAAIISNENLEMIDFLLTSPKLKEHADLHHKNDYLFRKAVKENKMTSLQYLICEYEIEESEAIKKAIKKRQDIQKMFEMRTLNRKLQVQLVNKETKIKKEKI